MISYGIMQGRLTPSKGRGIQFFPFDNWKNEFIIASRLGINEIEFIFDYEKFESNPLWTKDGVNEVKSIISSTGVKIKSLCFDYFMRRPFYKYSGIERENVREENKVFLIHIIEAMSQIGGELVEIPAVDNSSLTTSDEKELFAVFIKEILKETEPNYSNIKIGLETDLDIENFVDFIDGISSKRLGANYDSGNSSGLGYDLYKEVTHLQHRILNIHIKDRIYKGTTVPLGTGSADFDSLFKGLNEIGYSNSFIIQAARGIDGEEENTIMMQKEFIELLVKKFRIK